MRNVVSGLKARSLILTALERGDRTVREVAEETGMSYLRVLYHLHLLEDFTVVERDDAHRPYRWSLTGLGQRRLDET
jgi:predicted transcriptional regulator